MMGAASLPTPQGSTPAGFATFLATIGQTSASGGDDSGFDQLLAAAPMPVAAPVKAAPLTLPSNHPGNPATTAGFAAIPTAVPTIPAAAAIVPPVAAEGAIAPTLAKPVVAAVDTPVVSAKTVEADAAVDPDVAAAYAAKLLIAVNGNTPAPQPKIGKTAEPKTGTGSETIGAPGADVGTVATSSAESTAPIAPTAPAAPVESTAAAAVEPAMTPAAAVAAMPVIAAIIAPPVGKPGKASEAATVATADAAPTADTSPVAAPATPSRPVATKPDAPAVETAPVAAPVPDKPRATPTLPLAAAGTETPTAKRAEAAPSMTIQFAQPAAPGATPLASAAQPVAVAERVLDLASDGAWIDQLAHDIAATKSESGDISFRLTPRHLGRLDVAMRMNDEGVSLKLDTQHEAAATIVTAAQGRLVEDLRQQGVRVTGSEVTHTPGEAGRQMHGQSQGQGRAAAQDAAHLIETASERSDARAKTDSDDAATDRRGRFA